MTVVLMLILSIVQSSPNGRGVSKIHEPFKQLFKLPAKPLDFVRSPSHPRLVPQDLPDISISSVATIMVLFFTSTGKSNLSDIRFRQLTQHCSIVVSPPALIYMSVASWK
jgi:hypothetical protein